MLRFSLLIFSIDAAPTTDEIHRQVTELNSRSDSNALFIQQMIQLYLQIAGVDGSIARDF